MRFTIPVWRDGQLVNVELSIENGRVTIGSDFLCREPEDFIITDMSLHVKCGGRWTSTQHRLDRETVREIKHVVRLLSTG